MYEEYPFAWTKADKGGEAWQYTFTSEALDLAMDNNAVKHAIDDLIDLVENGCSGTEPILDALELALDKLALVRHHLQYEFEEGHPDPPRKDYDEMRALVGQRFTAFGYYNRVEDVAVKIGQTETMLGDAVDDLADIVLDLYKVKWRWENTSEADALWHFETMFGFHWGMHLRNLQLFLYELRNGC